MQEVITLMLPNFTTIKTVYAQIRPYRKKGIRIEHQNLKGKELFHNYGHGGSGISLSYGSAQICAKQVFDFTQNKSEECAVIGAGIMGMLTSLQLAKKGYKVTIYSQKFSRYGEKNNKQCITSQVAPGLWQPYWYYNTDSIKHQVITRLSYEYFNKKAEDNNCKSVRRVTIYDKNRDEEAHKAKGTPQQIMQSFKTVNVSFGGGKIQKFLQYKTIQINVELFLEELKQQALKMGIKMINKCFNQLQQVLSLNENIIVNCTGFGSKRLFMDESLEASRGHLLQFQNQYPKSLDYVLTYRNIDDSSFDIYCHNHRILVGYYGEVGEQAPDVQSYVVKKLSDMANKFVQQKRCIKQKL